MKMDMRTAMPISVPGPLTRIREAKSELMDIVKEILVETSRENANISNSPSAKMPRSAWRPAKSYSSEQPASRGVRPGPHGRGHPYPRSGLQQDPQLLADRLTSLLKRFNTGYGYIRPPKRIVPPPPRRPSSCRATRTTCSDGQSFPTLTAAWEIIRGFKEKPDYEEIYQAMEG